MLQTEIIAMKSPGGSQRFRSERAIFELSLSCLYLSALLVSLHTRYGPLMLLGCRLSLSVFVAFTCPTVLLLSRAPRRQCFKFGTEHKRGTPVRQILAARWIGKKARRLSE